MPLALRHKTLILWLAVIIFIAIVGYGSFKDLPVLTSLPSETGPPQTDPLEIGRGSVPIHRLELINERATPSPQSAGVKTYKNPGYEFDFTYPASFGEVTVKNEKCPPARRSLGEGGKGFMTIGSFTGNPNIDFGFVTSDYEKCNDNGFLLFETRSYDLLDKKLKLFSSATTKPVEVLIEQTIPTATPGLVAYVIKNTLEANGKGEAAVILRSPNPSIGALTFRTHLLPYQDGVKLLEAIIK